MNAMPDTTAPAIDPAQAIGQIAVQLPGSTAIFRRLKLDFGCGGQVSLRQAVGEKGLDLPAVLQELSALQRSDDAPQAGAPAELIDHIISRYHEVHRAQLPELIRMARRVEAVHRGTPNVPAGLADALEAMQEELLSHMHKEEAVLFPLLRTGGHALAHQPIGMMRAEHTDHGEALEHIASLTGDITPPPQACNTWRALYAGLAQLREDLISHIHLENNVLFPQFEGSSTQGSQGCGSSACACS